MKIRILRGTIVKDGKQAAKHVDPGTVLAVGDKLGHELVAIGRAEEVTGKKEADEKEAKKQK